MIKSLQQRTKRNKLFVINGHQILRFGIWKSLQVRFTENSCKRISIQNFGQETWRKENIWST